MYKIAFFCIPAYGHTNPTLPVVRELVARGHQVQYYSFEAFREKIEGAGAEFIPCDAYNPEMALNQADAAKVGTDMGFSIQLLVETTLALDPMVMQAMRPAPPDCIVADSMAAWGKAAARKLGVPFMSSTTTFAFNRYAAKIIKQNPAQLWNMLCSIPKMNREVARLRGSGYPVRNALELISNDDKTNTIVYTSPAFQPCAETFPPCYHFVGPSIAHRAVAAAQGGKPQIYISLGTVVNNQPEFYKNCIRAFEDAPYHITMSVGAQLAKAGLGPLPANVTVAASVDQIAVLQQTDVFLSHGGMNSVSESLYYGVPLVLYPCTAEQGGVARRVEQLGAGLVLKTNTPAAIRQAVEAVLANPNYRRGAGEISAGFRQCGGPAAAADAILALAAGNPGGQNAPAHRQGAPI
ncbi:MAG: glycosyltransferase [Gemmiger sp.]|nr:glycosyltransferase [Gemmiger sp.]